MLLQRVDVVTSGVSAVYGSDAVSGVVNFVTDTSFDGLKVDARTGISQLGDGEHYKFGIAGGTYLMDDRLHVMGSYEYFNSPGIFDKLTRQFGRDDWSLQGRGTAALPATIVKDTRLNQTSFLGNIIYGNNNLVFLENSSAGTDPSIVQPFRHGTPTNSSTVESGGDGGYFYNASLQDQQRSHLAYGRLDFDVTDNVTLYALGTYNSTFNRNFHESVEFRLQTIDANNGFLPIALQDQLTGDGISTVRASKIITQVPAKSPNSYIDTWMAVGGLMGQLGAFNWDVSYQHAQNKQNTRLLNNTDNQRAAAALDAVDEGYFTTGVRNGNIVCAVTITNPGLYPGCVPINIFGPTSESQAALDYVLTTTQFTARTALDTFTAQISGPVFDVPAGEVLMALSGEYRKLTYSVDSDAEPLQADCTGLRYNCAANTLIYQSNVRGSLNEVSQSVKEAAVEIDVPILRDSFVDSLSINGAARYTDYSNSGTVYTWKAGLEVAPVDGVRLRLTRSRDIRAPTLVELYAPRNVNPAGNTDLHFNPPVVGQIPNITDSNPDLEPEVANTLAIGLVLQPAFLPNFSLSVDYYEIDISGAISNIQGQSILVQQLCEDSNGTSDLCDLIERPLPFGNRDPVANFATAFYSRPLNANSVTTKGVDVELSYSADVGPGTLSFRSLASYQPELKTTQVLLGGTAQETMGADENPKVKITSFLNYRLDRLSVGLTHRWWSSEYYNTNQIPGNTASDFIVINLDGEDRVPAYATVNLNIGYDITDNANVYFGVTNLMDKQPTPIGRLGGPAGVPGLFGGFRNGEDTIGRYFSLGFRYRS